MRPCIHASESKQGNRSVFWAELKQNDQMKLPFLGKKTTLTFRKLDHMLVGAERLQLRILTWAPHRDMRKKTDPVRKRKRKRI